MPLGDIPVADSVPDGELEFDLTDLSAYNHAGIRGWRFALAAGTGIALTAIASLEWLLLTSAPIRGSEPVFLYTLAGAWLLVAYLLIVIGSYATKFWARPPIRMRAVRDGLVFFSLNGHSQLLGWRAEPLEVQLLDRSADRKVPEASRYRLWVRGSRRSRWLPWRRVIPLVYLTEPAAEAILMSAKRAGVRIVEQSAFTPISVVSTRSCRAFLLG